MASPKKLKKKLNEEKNTEKLKRKNLQEQQRRIKPGECIKYIRCIMDPEILQCNFGSQIASQLEEAKIKYVVDSCLVPKLISWERSDQQTLTESKNLIGMTEKFHSENQFIHIISGDELIDLLEKKKIKEHIQKIYDTYRAIHLTLIIFCAKKFVRQQDQKNAIEKVLTEIQVDQNLCYRYHETSAEVAETILQFSKAVAEKPYKKQESDRFVGCNAFLLNDKKDCVTVDGHVGLSRLWQSHLTRLPNVTLEVAETIMTEYPNPTKLLQAYANATQEDGENLLSDLKIRRAVGPLQSNRRLGPELSRKIYRLYNSLDPNEVL